MEKKTLGKSKPDTLQGTSKIEKYKQETEYDKLLLRRAPDSKRERREETGLKLVIIRPDFSLYEEKIWVEFEFKKGQMEGWEKLCVEAYCIGWLDFYDNHPPTTRPHKIYFDWRDESEVGGRSRVTIYIDPGPREIQGLTPPTKPPQPPPPPMG